MYMCVCVCACCGVLDCFSCCNELICEIELCLHTAAPATWHSTCECVRSWMALVMVNERSERERRQMDCPEGQETEREGERKTERKRDRQRKREKRNTSLPVTHLALLGFLCISALCGDA